MALQRSLGTSSLMNVIRKTEDQRVVGKEVKVAGKMGELAGPRVTRAALRNLSNQATTNQVKGATQKILNKEPAKLPIQKGKKAQPLQPAPKESSLKVESQSLEVVKHVEAVVEDKCREQETAAEPVEQQPATAAEPDCDAMDVSCMSQSDGDLEQEAFSKQMWKLNVHDIDADDANNPQLVSEYINDIYEYLRELERRFVVRPQCLAHQTEINGRMRGILVDWLVQVHLRFQLLQETLFLTVSILDRYLQIEDVAKSQLQMVGVTAMWIAAKYEEMYAPEVADFVYITDNAYTAVQIRHMECTILKALDFEIGRPLAIHFLRRNSKAADADATIHTLAKYLVELTIVDYDMIHMNPSLIAAAALWLSLKLISQSAWTATLVYYSSYTETQLLPVVRKMADLALNAGNGRLTAIRNKYQSSKLMRISRSAFLDNELLTELSESRTTGAQ